MRAVLLTALLAVALLVFSALFVHSAFALRATGGYDDDLGFYPAGQDDPCASGTIHVGQPTTGYDPDTGRWFDEFTHVCADGTQVTVRVDRGVTPVAEEANFEPDPGPGCVEAHYTDDPENPWDEGTC